MDSIRVKTGMFVGKNMIFTVVLLILTSFSVHAFESMKAEAQNDRITLKIKKYNSTRKPIETPVELFSNVEKQNHHLISSLIHAEPIETLARSSNEEFKASKETLSITEVIRTAQLDASERFQAHAHISLFIALMNPEPMEEFLTQVYSSARQKILTDMVGNLIITREKKSGAIEVVATKEQYLFNEYVTTKIRTQIASQHTFLAQLLPIPENKYVSNLPVILTPTENRKTASMVAILSTP